MDSVTGWKGRMGREMEGSCSNNESFIHSTVHLLNLSICLSV